MRHRRLTFALVVTMACSGEASPLTTNIIFLTDRVYEAIDVDSVTAESHHPTKQWFQKLRSSNRSVAREVTLQPLAELEVRQRDRPETTTSLEPLMLEAKRIAAGMGGNYLYLDRYFSENDRAVVLSFKIYRVEHQQSLVLPGYLASYTLQDSKP